MTKVVAYGLTIQSEIPLPEAPATKAIPQVTVRLGKVEKPLGRPDAERSYAIDRDRFRVYWRGAGTFLISLGREVAIEPEPDAEEEVVRQYLLGPALGVLLHQRGFLVLHASVVSIGGAVVGFLGEKGGGKSTMAAALNARGHALVTDDVLPVLPCMDGAPMIQPGLPHFKLWPEAVEASFGENPTTLVRLSSKVEKRFRVAKVAAEQKPMPLQRLYVLDRGEMLESMPMTPSMALLALVRHSYLSHLMKSLDGTRENFLQCSRLVRYLPVHRLQRPRNLNALGKIVQLLEAEAHSNAPVFPMDTAMCC